MRVSIITVCYNSEATIEASIKSVLSQDHADIEFIIIDGKSTDNTLSILDKYRSDIAKIISEKDKGMYDALNKGIALASGDIIGILHSDDTYPHSRIISRIVKEFETKKVDCTYGDLQYVSRADNERVIRYWKANPYTEKLFLKGWMPPHPSFFVKPECYKKFGVFDLSFSISADYELMLRFLYKHKISSSYIPEVIVKMNVGGISNRSVFSRIKANKEDRRAWKINGLKPGSFTLILKPLSKLRQWFEKE